MNPREPKQDVVSLKDLAELCGDDVDALYWLSQQYPDSIESASESLCHWADVLRPWLVEFQDEYHNGDAKAAFEVLSFASIAHFSVPDWAVQAISHGWGAYITWRPGAESIHEAMGAKREHAKEKANRRRVLLEYAAWHLVRAHKRETPEEENNSLHTKVAEELLNPSTIADPALRKGVERAREIFREEFGEDLPKFSGATVERWYGDVNRRESSTKQDTGGKNETEAPRFHFIFDKSKN